MSNESLDNLTKRHDEALIRLGLQETAAKKNRNYLIITALTAILGGSGSATAILGNDDEKVKDVVAAHVASADEWRPGVNEDLRSLREQQIRIREALVKLQTIMEERTRGGNRAHLKEIESLLGDMVSAPRRTRGPPSEPKADKVRQYRRDLFPD